MTTYKRLITKITMHRYLMTVTILNKQVFFRLDHLTNKECQVIILDLNKLFNETKGQGLTSNERQAIKDSKHY